MTTTATTPVNQLFKRSTIVEHDGERLLCRLPNQFQHQDIRGFALAAKARRMRALRDPESDASVVLENDMDVLAEQGDMAAVIDELIAREWYALFVEAEKDARDLEEFEHIQRDEARLLELESEDGEESDERSELRRHMARYEEAVEKFRMEREKPKREALERLETHQLVDLVRDERVKTEGNIAFSQTYSMWLMCSGTYTVKGDDRPDKRYFTSIDDVRSADLELIEKLNTAYKEMETSFARGLSGNS